MKNEVTLLALNLMLIVILAILGYCLWRFIRRAQQLTKEKKSLLIKYTKLELFFKRLHKTQSQMAQKEDFKLKVLSVASHDLRTPFQNLKMLLTHADGMDFSEKDIKWINTLLRNQIQVSEEVLENLLFWTSQQLDVKDSRKESFSVAQEIDTVVRLFSLQMNSKNILLKNVVPEDMVGYGKIEVFQFILRNLLSNAIKFSHEDGLIELGTSTLADSTKSFLYVRDFGSGMEDVVLQKIKSRAYQTSLAGTNNEKGSGLGLALCQDLIERIGWRLDVQSKLGQGSTFRLLLPLRANSLKRKKVYTLPITLQRKLVV